MSHPASCQIPIQDATDHSGHVESCSLASRALPDLKAASSRPAAGADLEEAWAAVIENLSPSAPGSLAPAQPPGSSNTSIGPQV